MSVGDIKEGVVRGVEHFQTLLIRNKMAKSAPGGVGVDLLSAWSPLFHRPPTPQGQLRLPAGAGLLKAWSSCQSTQRLPEDEPRGSLRWRLLGD